MVSLHHSLSLSGPTEQLSLIQSAQPEIGNVRDKEKLVDTVSKNILSASNNDHTEELIENKENCVTKFFRKHWEIIAWSVGIPVGLAVAAIAIMAVVLLCLAVPTAGWIVLAVLIVVAIAAASTGGFGLSSIGGSPVTEFRVNGGD